MYKTAVRAMIRRNVRALQEGDITPILAGYAEDAVLVFPGTSSWGGEYRGKAAIAQFLNRFIDVGLAERSTTSWSTARRGEPRYVFSSPTRPQTTPVRSSTKTERYFLPGSCGARSSTKKTSKTPTKSKRSTPTSPTNTLPRRHCDGQIQRSDGRSRLLPALGASITLTANPWLKVSPNCQFGGAMSISHECSLCVRPTWRARAPVPRLDQPIPGHRRTKPAGGRCQRRRTERW